MNEDLTKALELFQTLPDAEQKDMLTRLIDAAEGKDTQRELEKALAPLSNQEKRDLSRLALVFAALQVEQDTAETLYFLDLLQRETAAGTITGARLHGYIAALEATLQKPGITFNPAESALADISCDLQTLETVLDRFFHEDMPKHAAALPSSAARQLEAVTDIYNTYSERIREQIQDAAQN